MFNVSHVDVRNIKHEILYLLAELRKNSNFAALSLSVAIWKSIFCRDMKCDRYLEVPSISRYPIQYVTSNGYPLDVNIFEYIRYGIRKPRIYWLSNFGCANIWNIVGWPSQWCPGADWHYSECGSAIEAGPQNCFGGRYGGRWGPPWPLFPPLFGGRSIFARRQISSTFRKISGAGPWFATLLKGSQSAPALVTLRNIRVSVFRSSNIL